MAPLSRELSGLILPHEHFGTHLDADGRTIDEELEKANFSFAGCMDAGCKKTARNDGNHYQRHRGRC